MLDIRMICNFCNLRTPQVKKYLHQFRFAHFANKAISSSYFATQARMSTMKPKYLVLNSNLMIPDFSHNIRIRLARLKNIFIVSWRCSVSALLAVSAFLIGPILFLYYEESLVSSNLNSKYLVFIVSDLIQVLLELCKLIWILRFAQEPNISASAHKACCAKGQ